MGDGFMGKSDDKMSKDFDTMKDMMTNIYDRLGVINGRMDVMEEAVTKSRLGDAKKALVKKLEHRRDVKFRKKKIKAEEKEEAKKIKEGEKEEVLKKDEAYKKLQEEFNRARKALGH